MAERFYRRLASFARVVLIDRRGTGLSDPLLNVYSGGDFGPWLEEAVSDLITVLDAIGSERVAVWRTDTGRLSRSLSPTFPDRVVSLVLVDPLVRLLATDDYPWGMTPKMRAAATLRIAGVTG
jgi:pimeloyl-ACP methyl ester carboxylesterase